MLLNLQSRLRSCMFPMRKDKVRREVGLPFDEGRGARNLTKEAIKTSRRSRRRSSGSLPRGVCNGAEIEMDARSIAIGDQPMRIHILARMASASLSMPVTEHCLLLCLAATAARRAMYLNLPCSQHSSSSRPNRMMLPFSMLCAGF